jgi:hypothetical protein
VPLRDTRCWERLLISVGAGALNPNKVTRAANAFSGTNFVLFAMNVLNSLFLQLVKNVICSEQLAVDQ